MREFNAEGPCDPERHYTVMREALVRKGLDKVEKGKYFTIFAPRQAGKTTYFQLLIRQLQNSVYLPLWISFEDLAEASKEEFYRALSRDLRMKLARAGVHVEVKISDQFSLYQFFIDLREKNVLLVLIIDEFDGVPEAMVNSLMHTFRKMYHEKEYHSLHSLILVGVRNITGVVLDQASPFNVADELEVPYFTRDEVRELIGQYEAESGQRFEKRVIDKLYENTLGQPGLVNAMCRELVERFCTDRKKPVDMLCFRDMLDYFLTKRIDKNISNIVSKAMQQKEFMLKVLFSEEGIPFHIYDERIKFLHANGVVAKDANDMVDVSIPIYKNALLAAFRPLFNGETVEYVSPRERFEDFLTKDGLDLDKIIRHYIQYVQRRGFRAFDTENLKESACHYSFDAYIHFFIQRVGGKTYMEVPTGRGRMDTLIVYRDKSYLVEVKRWTDPGYFERGKRQLARYAKSEGLDEAYYIVFSGQHREDDTLYQVEDIDGVKIYTYIVRTNFEQASRQRRSKSEAKKK